jgi:hypothetical protein
MEDFLADPSESKAMHILATIGLEGMLQTCNSEEQASTVLRLLFQVNRFNVLTAVGCGGVVRLLSFGFVRGIVLEHLAGVEFPAQDYSELIRVLFEILLAEDISTAILSKNVLSSKLGHVLCQENYAEELRRMLGSEDSTRKIRVLEMVIEVGNRHDFESLDRSGLFDMGIEMATGDDLLLRIVTLEVIIDLGHSEKGCQKLLGAKMRGVLKSAIEEESDPHLRNKLMLITGKIFYFTGNETVLDGKFWQVLGKMLDIHDPASAKNAFETISYLSSRGSGLAMVLSRPALIQQWLKLHSSANQSVKAHFYYYFSKTLVNCNEQQIALISRAADLYPKIAAELLSPFQEMHPDILRTVKTLARVKEQAEAIWNNSQFRQWLFKRPPNQAHEVSCLKFEVVTELAKHEWPESITSQLTTYLNAGVFAASAEFDLELSSSN